MRAWSAAVLSMLLFASVLTAWVPQRWPASILEVGSYLLAMAWIVKLCFTAERPRWSPIAIPVTLIVVWGTIQLACHWTVAVSETVRATLAWAANLAILFSSLQTFDKPAIRERFLRGLLWFGTILSVVSILQSFTSRDKVFWLFPVSDPTFTMGPFLYHNHYAAFLEAVLPLALLGALEDREKRLWFSSAAAIMLASIIVSASRSGFAIAGVETAAVVGLYQWRNPSGWARMLPVVAGILLTTVALTAVAGWGALGARLQEHNAYYDRLQMLHSSFDMFRENALTGVGLGNWPTVFPRYARYDDGLFANQAHNDWVQAAAEGGMLTFAAFVWLFVRTLRLALQNPWCAGPVFVFAHASIDYPFHKPQVAALVFMLLAAGTYRSRSRSLSRSRS